MIKKKYINGILIVFLLVIWGSVGYKYFSNQSFSREIPIGEKKTRLLVKKEMNIGGISYPDFFYNGNNPFLRNSYMYKSDTLIDTFNLVVANANNTVENKEPINWPDIEYYGFVKSEQSKSPLAVLTVNGVIFKGRIKESFNEIIIKKIYNDSLCVKYLNNERIINKKR